MNYEQQLAEKAKNRPENNDPRSPLQTALDLQDDTINRLEEITTELKKYLGPVSFEPPTAESESSGNVDKARNSQVVERINEHSRRIDWLGNYLQDIKRNLEV